MIDNISSIDINILILWHLCIASSVTFFAMIVLKKRYPQQKSLIFSFFFIFSLSLPLLGSALSLWLIYYFWHYEHSEEKLQFNTINLDPFFFKFPLVKRQFGDAAAYSILSTNSIPLDKQLKILGMLSKHKNRSNIQMVKKMLSSKNDELRLLSFATINELEESIHAEIHKYNEKLEILDNSEYEKRAYINKKLALAYWELIYFQLADEALKKFILKKVEGYASSALRVLKNDESMYLLLGKVYLERKDDSIAIKYFNKSIEISESKNFSNSKYIVPYLAEISFNNRNFNDVKKMISEVDTFRQNQVLKPIYEIWS